MEGIHAAPTIHPRQLRGVASRTEAGLQRTHVAGVDHNGVVARAAVQHIRAAKACDGVVAAPPHDGLTAAGPRQDVIAAGPHLVHCGLCKRAGS